MLENQGVLSRDQGNIPLWTILTKDSQARHGSGHSMRIFSGVKLKNPQATRSMYLARCR